MKTTTMFVSSIIFFVSCVGPAHFIQHTDSSYQEVNQELKGKTVTVVKMNEDELFGKYVRVTSDSMTVGIETIAIENVKEVRIKNHSKGAMVGMGLGFLAGVAIGIINLEHKSENKQPSDNLINIDFSGVSEATEGFTFVMEAAGIGLLLGGIIGGASGVTDKFVFPPTELKPEPAKPTKPTNRVEFTKVVEKGRGYIIILWQGKEIRLLKAEYNYMVETDDGKQIIVVPEEVYLEKFE